MQDPATTLAVFFEVGSSRDKGADPQQFYLQFITRYLHEDGTARTRVTTISRRYLLYCFSLAQCFNADSAPSSCKRGTHNQQVPVQYSKLTDLLMAFRLLGDIFSQPRAPLSTRSLYSRTHNTTLIAIAWPISFRNFTVMFF